MNRIRLIDWLSRKRSWEYYQDYLESQWYDREALNRYRVDKLRRLLAHCEKSVPFYGEIIRQAGIRADRVQSLEVLRHFPIIEKALVKARYEEFRSTTTAGLGVIRYTRTGGTTGEPLRVPKDVALRSSAQASMFRFHAWMGVRVGDPVVVLWGAPIVGGRWPSRLRAGILRMITNTRQIDTFGISHTDVPTLSHLFEQSAPVLLHGYCQTIHDLARWFLSSGRRFPLKAVSTTVEPLFPEYRAVFREAFCCEAFDQYGCGEVEAIAMECQSHQGLHVMEERVVLEVDDENNVIVTDLDNLAFPFIRYRNGDKALLATRSCPCGRVHQLLERVLGRVGDVIVGPSGNRVHPEFFTHLLNETGLSEQLRLRRYQVVQESGDRLVWKLAGDQLQDDDRLRLIKHLRAYLGDIHVSIERVDDIPNEASGKFRYVIAKR